MLAVRTFLWYFLFGNQNCHLLLVSIPFQTLFPDGKLPNVWLIIVCYRQTRLIEKVWVVSSVRQSRWRTKSYRFHVFLLTPYIAIFTLMVKTWPCSATLAAGDINKFGIDCLPHCRAAGNWVLRHRLAAHSQYPSVGRCYHFAKSIRPYIAKILFQLSAILQVYDFVSRHYTRQHRETLFADITFKGLQYVFHTFIRKTTHENW